MARLCARGPANACTPVPAGGRKKERRSGRKKKRRKRKKKRALSLSLSPPPPPLSRRPQSKKAPGTLSPTSWWRARAPAPARLSRQRLLDSRSHAHAHAPGSVHMRSRMHALVHQRRGQPKRCPAKGGGNRIFREQGKRRGDLVKF